MVLVDSDLQLVKSAHTVSGIDSLGGEMTATVVSESIESLWDEIKNSELSGTVVGEYEVRCIYVRNFSLNNETMQQCQVWIEQNTASPFTDIDIAIGTAATGDIEQTVASEDILPDNVGWTFARGEENAEFLSDIPAGKGKSLWVRRHAGPAKSGSSYPSDNYILRFKFLKSGALEPGPGPDPTLDPFGIRMIYKTQTTGDVSAPFFMNMNDPYSDCRFNTTTGSTATKNGDGSWALGPSPRIRLYSSQPGCARDIYDVPLDTYDHDIWGDRGYMKAPNDWKNVEITGYFKVVSVDPANISERKLYLYSRTFRHNTRVGGGCSGTAYKGVIYGNAGELKWHKESFHDGSQPCGDRDIESFVENVAKTDSNTWFGMKVMMWNYANPANPNVKYVHLELWLDLSNTNTWVKMGEREDTGGWYPGNPDPNCPGDENCGGHQDQIISWGGPTTEIRWDAGYTSVHFKNLSCREIVPSTTIPPPPPPPPPPAPAPPPILYDVFGTTQIYTTKTNGRIWGAAAWSNGISRNIQADPDDSWVCVPDPYDSKFAVSSADNPNVTIDGNGILKADDMPGTSGSPRLTIPGPWQNVEQTVYLRATIPAPEATNPLSMDLRPKSDHYCDPNYQDQFGGYTHRLDFELDEIRLRKEQSHAIGYSEPMQTVSFTLTSGVWYGMKAICYNMANGHVKQETWMDTTNGADGGTWVKVNEFEDDGTWQGPIVTKSCNHVIIRNNLSTDGSFIEYKKVTVREIIPPV